MNRDRPQEVQSAEAIAAVAGVGIAGDGDSVSDKQSRDSSENAECPKHMAPHLRYQESQRYLEDSGKEQKLQMGLINLFLPIHLYYKL